MICEKEDQSTQSQWLIRPSTEDDESQDGEPRDNCHSTPARKILQNPKVTAFMVVTVVLYAALLTAYVLKEPSDQECHRRLSVWCTPELHCIKWGSAFVLIECQAPLNDAIEYSELDFENPFAHPSIYRGPPTPELETAWDELWNSKPFLVRCLTTGKILMHVDSRRNPHSGGQIRPC